MARYYSDPLDPSKVALTQNPYISDASYREVVQKMLIPCTDAVLTMYGDAALYLAKRCIYPMKGAWVLGGRVSFNDLTLEESIARCLRLETGKRFDLSRLKALGQPHLYSWVKTQQGDFAGKNLVFTFQLEVTSEELAEMAKGLDPKEYETAFGIQRFSRERLVDERVHPALVDMFDDIFS